MKFEPRFELGQTVWFLEKPDAPKAGVVIAVHAQDVHGYPQVSYDVLCEEPSVHPEYRLTTINVRKTFDEAELSADSSEVLKRLIELKTRHIQKLQTELEDLKNRLTYTG